MCYSVVLKAAIAHFWFIIIHPFDDGNGRIARTLSDMLLARSEESNQSKNNSLPMKRLFGSSNRINEHLFEK